MTKILVIFAVLSASLFADSDRFISRSLPRRVEVASSVLRARMTSREAIPQFIIDNSKCIASVKVVKAGFIWGGEGSTGMVSCRLPNGEWSAPSFLNTGGVSFGLQIGLQFMETVLVFMDQHSRNLLDVGTVQLGGNVGFAAGPVGQGLGAGVIPRASVLSYNFAYGLYAGATINGYVLTHAPVRNEYVYGKNRRPSEILRMPGNYAPKLVMPYVDVLNQFTR